MKRFFIIALAVLSTVACSKSDDTIVTNGESLNIEAEETRVTLAGTSFVYEAGDQIGAYALVSAQSLTLQNTAAAVRYFSGASQNPFGATTESFHLFYPATAANASGVFTFTQTGKPWLVADAVNLTREGGKYYLHNIRMATPDAVHVVAITSEYAATIVFTAVGGETLTTYNPVSGWSGTSSMTTSVAAGGTTFVNIPTLASGFKLAVTTATGTMYKSYGYGTSVSTNRLITLTSAAFAPLSVTLTGDTTIYTSYTKKATSLTEANALDGKKLYLRACGGTIQGLSSTLYNTMITECGICYGSASAAVSAYTYVPGTRTNLQVVVANSDLTLGVGAYKAYAYLKLEDGSYLYSAARDLYVTGIPTTISPPTNSWSNASWNVRYESSYVQLGGVSGSGTGAITSPDNLFYFPGNSNVNVVVTTNVHIAYYRFIGAINTTFTVKVSGSQVISQSSNDTAASYTLSGNGTLVASNPVIYCKSSYDAAGPYCQLYWIKIAYR